jgi:hypothetical protein
LATTTADNNASLISKDVVVYSNNYYAPTPQEAYSAGLNYRSPYYWYVNLNFNYFDQMSLEEQADYMWMLRDLGRYYPARVKEARGIAGLDRTEFDAAEQTLAQLQAQYPQSLN